MNTKYLKYALGEIVLVVIGILIALSINNWNESRKEDKKIAIALKSLKNELIQDTMKMNRQLKIATQEFEESNNIYNRIRSKEATLDTLIYLARYVFKVDWVSHIDYNTATIENMKSSDTFELLPIELKNEITSFYNSQQYWSQIADKVFEQYQVRFEDYTRTYLFQQSNIGFNQQDYSNNYINRILWKDIDPAHFTSKFLFLVGSRTIMWKNYMNELNTMIESSKGLLDSIDKRLD